METVKAECDACGGTGVYSGFAEPPGVGVVCLQCGGTGCHEIRYKPFVRRKRKRGIKTVRVPTTTFLITGVGPKTDGIPYRDFLKGKNP